MKLNCSHGFFKFYETSAGQISDFMTYSGFEMVKKDDFFTFKSLENAPSYTIAGKSYLGFTATETFEGSPEAVFKANGVVYDFTKDLVTQINTIQAKASVINAGNYYLANGLILPGSRVLSGQVITGFTAFWSARGLKWFYTGIDYV